MSRKPAELSTLQDYTRQPWRQQSKLLAGPDFLEGSHAHAPL
jgi:hypothetical protein